MQIDGQVHIREDLRIDHRLLDGHSVRALPLLPTLAYLPQRWASRVERFILWFLPHGYPKTVHDGYLSFHGWLFAKSTLGAVAYVLATHSLLTAVGVGSGVAIPLSATISWILKDGLGCIGQILAAHRLGTRFDSFPKINFFYGDLLFNLGVWFEVATAAFPSSFFVPVAAMATTMKAIAALMSGASRAEINRSLSRNNLGDITAKGHAQATAGYVIGMGAGIVASLLLEPYGLLATGAAVLLLTAGNMGCSYLAVRGLPLKTLNPERLVILQEYFSRFSRVSLPHLSQAGATQTAGHPPLTPTQVADLESIVFGRTSYRKAQRVVFGASLQQTFDEQQRISPDLFMALFQEGRRFVWKETKSEQMDHDSRLVVCLHAEATGDDRLQAFFTAACLLDGIDHHTAGELYPSFREWLLASGWSVHNASLSEVSAARYSTRSATEN